MSRDGSIILPWGGEDRLFRIQIAQLEKIQEARDVGAYVMLDRLVTGRWFVQDIREVLRWGLIGGGMEVGEVSKLLKLYFESMPPAGENLITAQRALGAGLLGAAEEELGKNAEAASQDNSSPTSPTES
jgi:hypothetical protein